MSYGAAMTGQRANARALRDAIIAKLRTCSEPKTAYELHGDGLQRLGSLANVRRLLATLALEGVAGVAARGSRANGSAYVWRKERRTA